MSFTLHPDLARDGIDIGTFPLCRVLLINDAAYPWFVLVPQRTELRDAIDLGREDYAALWDESRIFSRCIMDIFDGEKLNIAALGNMTPQLHVHHIVRFKSAAAWPGPIWGQQPLTPYSKDAEQAIAAKLADYGMQKFTTR